MRWILGYVAALCVLVLIVCTSVSFPTFFEPFYAREYDKYSIPETIRVEKEELMNVTKQLLDYMRGRRADLVVPAIVNGMRRDFFNQREKDHMADVQRLFDIGFRVRNTAFWLLLLLILIMIAMKMRVLFILSRCVREVLAGFLILAVIMAVIMVIDFDQAFYVFHLLFFTNDLWILDPATDLLVNIVPTGFFMDIALFIGGLILAASAALITAATLYMHRAARTERYPEHS